MATITEKVKPSSIGQENAGPQVVTDGALVGYG